MFKRTVILPMIILMVFFLGMFHETHSYVTRKGGKTYIVDRNGERWDVTQAKSLGFKPEKLQYGIGRNAFKTLNDSDMSDDTSSVSGRSRVIGVSVGEEAHAYTISKLRRHEVANTTIDEKPIAAGY